MKKIKIILDYLLGLFLSLLISVLALLLILHFTVYDKNYINNILEQENYYEDIDKEIQSEMEMMLLSTGFTNDILKDIYTKEELLEDMKLFNNNLYEGKITQLDKNNIKEKIDKNIEDFLAKSNLKIVYEEDVNHFTSDLVDIYKNEVCLYHFIDNYINLFAKLNHYINIALIIVGVLIVGSIVTLFLMKSKVIASSFFASGLIILFIRLFVFERIDGDYLLIITEKFSRILSVILQKFGYISLIVAISLIGFGILCLCKVAISFHKKSDNLLKFEN